MASIDEACSLVMLVLTLGGCVVKLPVVLLAYVGCAGGITGFLESGNWLLMLLVG